MKNIFANKKILICAIGGSIVFIVIVVLIINLLFSGNQQKKLEKELNHIAEIYYEKMYYPLLNQDTKTEFLSNYNKLGIKADLENLIRTIDGLEGVESSDKLYEKFVNKKTGEACNKTKTKVTIYPTEPYGEKDYKIETQLECGFEK